jgi:hypothetical protein
MRQLLRVSCILAIAVAATAGASGARKAPTVRASTGPLNTGIQYYDLGSSAANQIEVKRIRAAGAGVIRIPLYWSWVAPSGSEPPAGFQPRDPADPNYDWQNFDAQIQMVSAAGLEPMVMILSAPEWAEGAPGSYPAPPGTYKPSPTALADFAAAAATRYSGSFEGLPRVRYWEVWNEPNLFTYLSPQTVNGTPDWYRLMLNAAADALHAVHSDNVVIGGDTAPYGNPSGMGTAPLVFMEKVLCISEKTVRSANEDHPGEIVYQSACKTKTKFDVWSHHPYTEGGPTIQAKVHGNVSLGDMGDMRAVLDAAIRAGHVVSTQQIRFWVTEFSWTSNPPDPKGVPAALEARWVSQALYQMWSDGVSRFVWYAFRDEPSSRSCFHAGLYYANSAGIASDLPKPALRAFRFPFVALTEPKNKVFLWGRTATSTAGNVLIERKSGGKWKRVKTLTANRYGIFTARISRPAKTTYLRARLSDNSDQSVAFSLIAPKNPWKGSVWGSGGC